MVYLGDRHCTGHCIDNTMDTQQQLSTICTFTSDVSLHLPKLYLYSNITSRTCRVDTATDTKIVRADNFLCRQRRNHTKYELAKWRRRHCVDTSQPQLAWRLIFMTHEARPAAATAATNYSCSTSAETCDRKCRWQPGYQCESFHWSTMVHDVTLVPIHE